MDTLKILTKEQKENKIDDIISLKHSIENDILPRIKRLELSESLRQHIESDQPKPTKLELKWKDNFESWLKSNICSSIKLNNSCLIRNFEQFSFRFDLFNIPFTLIFNFENDEIKITGYESAEKYIMTPEMINIMDNLICNFEQSIWLKEMLTELRIFYGNIWKHD